MGRRVGKTQENSAIQQNEIHKWNVKSFRVGSMGEQNFILRCVFINRGPNPETLLEWIFFSGNFRRDTVVMVCVRGRTEIVVSVQGLQFEMAFC